MYTGTNVLLMKLELRSAGNKFIVDLSADDRPLGFYSPADGYVVINKYNLDSNRQMKTILNQQSPEKRYSFLSIYLSNLNFGPFFSTEISHEQKKICTKP